MKKILPETSFIKVYMLSFMLFFSGIALFGQEVQFPPAVISSGGGHSSFNAVNLTRWRIGEVHMITLPSDTGPLKQAGIATTPLTGDWSVSLYPNPVNDRLHIRFNTDLS